MKRTILAIFTTCFLIFLPVAVLATPESEALRKAMLAQVEVQTTCTLTVSSADGGILLKMLKDWLGNGYFVEHRLSHLVKTAGHVVDCAPSEQTVKNIKKRFGAAQALSISYSASVSIVYQNKEYPARILKYSFGEGKPDYGVLLAVDMPDSVDHDQLPIIVEDGVYAVGDEIVISGKLPFGEAGKEKEWYLKKVLIARLDDQAIKFSEPVYEGLSGSPSLFYYKNRYYAVGTVVSGWGTNIGGESLPIDAGTAIRLQKEFFDIDAKTAL